MLLKNGEKLHIMYRSLYEKSTRRHFIGEVLETEGALCRLEGFVFIYDEKQTEFYKKPEKRITIIDVADSGFITNVIASDVALSEVHYRYVRDVGLVATDDKQFSLNINEFGARS